MNEYNHAVIVDMMLILCWYSICIILKGSSVLEYPMTPERTIFFDSFDPSLMSKAGWYATFLGIIARYRTLPPFSQGLVCSHQVIKFSSHVPWPWQAVLVQEDGPAQASDGQQDFNTPQVLPQRVVQVERFWCEKMGWKPGTLGWIKDRSDENMRVSSTIWIGDTTSKYRPLVNGEGVDLWFHMACRILQGSTPPWNIGYFLRGLKEYKDTSYKQIT